MPNEALLSVVKEFESLPLETRWFLRGLQMGIEISAKLDDSLEEEMARVGLVANSGSGACAGNRV